MRNKRCAVCGRDFVGHHARLYCCTNCKDQHDLAVLKKKQQQKKSNNETDKSEK